MTSTEDKSTKSQTASNGFSKAQSGSAARIKAEDLEFAIDMLRIRMRSALNLSEKIRDYNEIKTLQDNIARLKEKGSSQRSESDRAEA